MAARRTVAASFAVEGVGVHSGAPARAVVRPGGDGIVFHIGARVPARLANVVASAGATVLGCDGASVAVVEHLLAALLAAGVTDADVDVDGPELPILDGSALPWLDAVESAGAADLGPLVPLRIVAPFAYEEGDAAVVFTPADRCEVTVDVDFGPPPLPRGRAGIELGARAFRDEVAWARTFALARDLERLRAAGRGRGASVENTVVYGDDGPWPPGERGPDEAVRHKLLDAIGDLALVGPILGRMAVRRGSHGLHHRALRALLASTAVTS